MPPPIVSLATETGQIVIDSKDKEIIVDDGILSVVDLTPSDLYPIFFNTDNKLTIQFTGNEAGTVSLTKPGKYSENAIGKFNNVAINFEINNGSLLVDFESSEAWGSNAIINMTAGSHLKISNDLVIHTLAVPVKESTSFPYAALLGSVSQVEVDGNVDISLKAKNWINNDDVTLFIGIWADESSSDPEDQPINEHWSFGQLGTRFHVHDIVAASTHPIVTASGVTINNSYNTTEIHGAAIIEDIHAVTSAQAQYGAYAVGAEVIGGTLIFHDALTIRNISAQSSAQADGEPWKKFTSGTAQLADEAYAISVYSNGEVLVNPEQKTTVDVVLENDLQSVDGGKLTVNFMNANSHFTGSTDSLPQDPGQYNLNFSNGAYWDMTDHSVATNLTVSNGGKLNLSHAQDFISLTTDSLSGQNGVVKLKVAGTASDKVYITGTHEGRHSIDIADIGNLQDDSTGVVLISVGKENGEFIAQDREGELFWDHYSLKRVASADDAYEVDWILDGAGHVEDPETGEDKETTTTSMVRVNGAIDYFMWRQENDILRDRFGELRYQNHHLNDGGWARISYGSLGRSGSSDFDADYQRLQLGFDRDVSPWASVRVHAGAAFDVRRGEADYERGSSDNNAYGLSLYASSIFENGAYLDLSLRYAYMTNEMTAFNTEGSKIDFDTHTNTLSASFEIGKKWTLNERWFIEPHVKTTVGRLWLGEDRLSNDVDVNFDDITSVVGRTGVTVGAKLSENLQATARASVLKEFEGKYRAKLSTSNAARYQSEDFDDTWGQFGLDVSYCWNTQGIFFAGLEYETGAGDLDDGLVVNAGMRFAF